MKLNLVFVKAPDHARHNLTKFLSTLNVATLFIDEVEEIKSIDFDGPVFLAAPFVSSEDFRKTRSSFRKSYGRDNVVAIIPENDHYTLADAFRSGACDILIAPYTSKEIERLVEELNSIAAPIIHPDAIVPLDRVERLAISEAILACKGQVSKTSRKLGIGRSTLYRKIEQYGLSETKLRDQE